MTNGHWSHTWWTCPTKKSRIRNLAERNLLRTRNDARTDLNRFWSLLFLLVPILGTASYLMSVFDIWPMQSTWLPENISTSGKIIDDLFNLIHIICAVIFIGTTTILAVALWKYRQRPSNAAAPFHSNVMLEVIWSIIPAGILIFLSLYQFFLYRLTTYRNRYAVDISGNATMDTQKLVVDDGWKG